jgi:chromosomal replication initiator protein
LPENRLAYTAATAWGKSDAETGPVYLYGPSGIGKSHLTERVLRRIAAAEPKLVLKQFTASQFAAELTEAIGKGSVRKLQKGYRDVDVVVVEDLQALERLPESQQQLLTLIDFWTAHGIRMLFTARKAPGELEDFSAKLTSRFRSGVCAALRPFSGESRRQLVAHFAQGRGMILPVDVIEHLARESGGSPRELVGLILRLDAYGKQSRSKVNLALVKKYLQGDPQPLPISLAEIVRATCRHFGIAASHIRSNRRLQVCVLPRQCAMYLAREMTAEHLAKIGAYFSGRDHSTVVRACQRIESLLPDDPELRRHLAQIRTRLGLEGNQPQKDGE